MPDFTDILYQKHHRIRGAARITINRPEVMNAFTGHTLTEMRSAVQDTSADSDVGVVVITGAGDRAFCAGGDVKWLQEVQREGAAGAAPVDPHAGIEDCLKPVIARVNGYSVGGGNHLPTSPTSRSPRSAPPSPRSARASAALPPAISSLTSRTSSAPRRRRRYGCSAADTPRKRP